MDRRGDLSRRAFLQAAGSAALGTAAGPPRGGPLASESSAQPPRASHPELLKLSEHLWIYPGPINVGVVRDGARALLVDCGDGGVADAVRRAGLTVDQIVFTHHHRDQACGAHALAEGGAKIGVPAGERQHFEDVAAYWADPKHRWHLYSQHPHHLMLAEPIRVDAAFDGGHTFEFGPARVVVYPTPGHTDGSVSYAVRADGQWTVFCGDAICDHGRIWELYSLQKGITTSDYHGFLGAMPQLLESLKWLRNCQRLVPSHGPIIDDPPRAVDALAARLKQCYEHYSAISALRHYFPKVVDEHPGQKGRMPMRPGLPVPDCLRHFGTTWMLVSQDKAALVMDCGGAGVVKRIQEMQGKGEIRRVEGLWITHYHDDHVDGIPAFQRAFDCPCITDRHVAEVVADPLAWRLPCISPARARVDRPTRDGETWNWHEFQLTAYHFPGQTLYHAGLLAQRGALRMLFVGDSFTMGGIDDYCAQNRNWLGRGRGFDHCLELIEKIRPTHIFNCHVDVAFDFTPEQCATMRANLAAREKVFGDLFLWDHPNYGMDESWVRCHPYEQQAAPGAAMQFRVVVTNHSATPRCVACRAILPRAWKSAATAWSADLEIPSTTDGQQSIAFRVPSEAPPGRYVIPIDVRYGERSLPQFTEAIVVVAAKAI